MLKYIFYFFCFLVLAQLVLPFFGYDPFQFIIFCVEKMLEWSAIVADKLMEFDSVREFFG